MKIVKGFVKTCYSEMLVANASMAENADEKAPGEASKSDPSSSESMYLGGLGLKFKFPGDAKKLREASKTKLWTNYLRSESCLGV